MLKKTKFSYLKNHFPICVFTLGLVFFIFLTCSVNAHAEGNPSHSYTLPYNIDDYSDNQTLFDGIGTKILSDYLSYQSSHPSQAASWDLDPENWIVIPYDFNSNKVRFYVCSDPIISDTSNISSIYSSRVRCTFSSNTNAFIFTYSMDSSGITDLWSISSQAQGWYIDFFGSSNIGTYQSTGLTYQFLYPVDITNDIYDINNNLVVTHYRGDLDEEEVFEELNQFLDITGTISNGIDDTLTDLQNQKGFFDNLISNLKNFFNTLKIWIYSGFSTLMSNIKNFFGPLIRNIYNKINIFLESFEDFKDKWNHFFEMLNSIYNLALENSEFSLAKLISVLLVPSQDDISSAFSGTVFYTLYIGVNNCSKYLYTYVTTLFSSSPNTFVMTLPTFTFGGKTFQGLQISFDWFIPYKTYFDIIVSGFLIMGYIRFLAMWINNFFHGSGFIDHDVNNISARSDSL